MVGIQTVSDGGGSGWADGRYFNCIVYLLEGLYFWVKSKIRPREGKRIHNRIRCLYTIYEASCKM